MTGLLAHGGVGGAIVEISLVLLILAAFISVWLRERAARVIESRAREDDAL